MKMVTLPANVAKFIGVPSMRFGLPDAGPYSDVVGVHVWAVAETASAAKAIARAMLPVGGGGG